MRVSPSEKLWIDWPSEFSTTDEADLPIITFCPYFFQYNVLEPQGRFLCLKYIRFEDFGSLRIEIDAPKTDDPGELIQSQNKLTFLAKFLSKRKLPRVELYFIETISRSWRSSGALSCTMTIPDENFRCDLEYLLTPFRRLRGLPFLTIYTASIELDDILQIEIRDVIAKATWTTPFGQYAGSSAIPEKDDLKDEDVQETEKACAMWFDFYFDDLPGYTASMLRMEQYASWSYQSAQTMQHLISWQPISDAQEMEIDDALERRRIAVYAFDPHGVRPAPERKHEVLEQEVDSDSGTDEEAWTPKKEWHLIRHDGKRVRLVYPDFSPVDRNKVYRDEGIPLRDSW